MRMHDELGETIEGSLEKLFEGRYKITKAENGEGWDSRGYVGVEGDRRVFIKVAKPKTDETDPVLNDIKIQKGIPINGAFENGIIPIIDYRKFNGSYVTVEPEFTGSKTLRDWGRGCYCEWSPVEPPPALAWWAWRRSSLLPPAGASGRSKSAAGRCPRRASRPRAAPRGE